MRNPVSLTIRPTPGRCSDENLYGCVGTACPGGRVGCQLSGERAIVLGPSAERVRPAAVSQLSTARRRRGNVARTETPPTHTAHRPCRPARWHWDYSGLCSPRARRCVAATGQEVSARAVLFFSRGPVASHGSLPDRCADLTAAKLRVAIAVESSAKKPCCVGARGDASGLGWLPGSQSTARRRRGNAPQGTWSRVGRNIAATAKKRTRHGALLVAGFRGTIWNRPAVLFNTQSTRSASQCRPEKAGDLTTKEHHYEVLVSAARREPQSRHTDWPSGRARVRRCSAKQVRLLPSPLVVAVVSGSCGRQRQ